MEQFLYFIMLYSNCSFSHVRRWMIEQAREKQLWMLHLYYILCDSHCFQGCPYHFAPWTWLWHDLCYIVYIGIYICSVPVVHHWVYINWLQCSVWRPGSLPAQCDRSTVCMYKTCMCIDYCLNDWFAYCGDVKKPFSIWNIKENLAFFSILER